jgi:protein-arginine kinase activator protein McsA
MNCDVCNNELATVHLTDIKDSRKVERHLCLRCASKETGLGNIPAVLTEFVRRHSSKPDRPGEPRAE